MRKRVVNEKNEKAVNTATDQDSSLSPYSRLVHFFSFTTRLRMWLFAVAASAAKNVYSFC